MILFLFLFLSLHSGKSVEVVSKFDIVMCLRIAKLHKLGESEGCCRSFGISRDTYSP